MSSPGKHEGTVETVEFAHDADPLHPDNLMRHLTDVNRRLLDDPEIMKAWMDPSLPNREEEKRMVRKVDLHMMPILWLMYIMNYLDSTSTSLDSVRLRSAAHNQQGQTLATPKSLAWMWTFTWITAPVNTPSPC
jgi:hypothetical protein